MKTFRLKAYNRRRYIIGLISGLLFGIISIPALLYVCDPNETLFLVSIFVVNTPIYFLARFFSKGNLTITVLHQSMVFQWDKKKCFNMPPIPTLQLDGIDLILLSSTRYLDFIEFMNTSKQIPSKLCLESSSAEKYNPLLEHLKEAKDIDNISKWKYPKYFNRHKVILQYLLGLSFGCFTLSIILVITDIHNVAYLLFAAFAFLILMLLLFAKAIHNSSLPPS